MRHPNGESPTCQEMFGGKFCSLQKVGEGLRVDCPGSRFLWHPVDSITPRGSCESGGELRDIFESLSAILFSPLGCWRLVCVSLKLCSAYHRSFCRVICMLVCPQKTCNGHGTHHMGSSEDEQDYEKRCGPAKIIWVVLHTVLLPCVLWLI